MITVEIYKDGSGLLSWSSRTGHFIAHTALAAEDIQAEMQQQCLNATAGCGMCRTCKIKEAVAEYVTNQIEGGK